MIGENRATSHQLNPNYDYEDSRNSIPMEGFRESGPTGAINVGMDGAPHSSPRQRHYSRDSMDPDGKRAFLPASMYSRVSCC